MRLHCVIFIDWCSRSNVYRWVQLHTDALSLSLAEPFDQLKGVESACRSMVLDSMFADVGEALARIPQLPLWSATSENQNPPTVAFALHPSEPITSTGDYLLSLPEQLEVLSRSVGASSGAGSGGPESDSAAVLLARQFLDEVCIKATDEYVARVDTLLASLSDQGRRQLLEDVNYIHNIISYLTDSIPEPLAELKQLLTIPVEEYVGYCGTLKCLPPAFAHKLGVRRAVPSM